MSSTLIISFSPFDFKTIGSSKTLFKQFAWVLYMEKSETIQVSEKYINREKSLQSITIQSGAQHEQFNMLLRNVYLVVGKPDKYDIKQFKMEIMNFIDNNLKFIKKLSESI